MTETKTRRPRGKTAEEKEAEMTALAKEARNRLEEEGTFVSPTREEETYPGPIEEPPPIIDDEALLATAEAAIDIFNGEMSPIERARLQGQVELLKEQAQGHVVSPAFRPPPNVFITVQGGGQYLPARWRVVWLRRQAETQGWSIQSELIEHDPGEFSGGGRGRATVKGGYALFKAHVLNEFNRIIGEGHALEWGSSFGDYVEKAETSAIARALAIAGFGTEAAMELDEGWIADSPIGPGGQLGSVEDPGPINIEPSNVTGVMVGGRQTGATSAQMRAIRDKANEIGLSPDTLNAFVLSTLGEAPDLTGVDSAAEQAQVVMGHLESLSFDEAGQIVRGLMEAAAHGGGD